jgi:hypothetical protein
MSSQPNSVISRTPESPRTPIAGAAATAVADHLHVPVSKFNGGNNTNGDAGEGRARPTTIVFSIG